MTPFPNVEQPPLTLLGNLFNFSLIQCRLDLRGLEPPSLLCKEKHLVGVFLFLRTCSLLSLFTLQILQDLGCHELANVLLV